MVAPAPCGLFAALSSPDTLPAGVGKGENGETGVLSGRDGGVTSRQRALGQTFEAQLTDFFERCTRDLPAEDERALVGLLLETLALMQKEGVVSSGGLTYVDACSYLFRLLFNLRDVRGGKGERLLAYRMLVQVNAVLPELTVKLLPLFVKEFGSFGDLARVHFLLSQSTLNVANESLLSSACVTTYVAQLVADRDKTNVTLCGKHAPREKKAANATTPAAMHANAMAGAIATQLFLKQVPKDDRHKHLADPEAETLTVGAKRHARKAYRQLCSQLTKKAKVVEQPMSDGAWDTIDPVNVPACAAKKYRAALQNRPCKGSKDDVRSEDPRRIACAERFDEAIRNTIATGSGGIKGAVAGAHGICKRYVQRGGGEAQPMLEAQWVNLIKETKAAGVLPPCLALCDVSGSMSGVPMEVCVALGLVVAELAPGPFQGHVLTFESSPVFHKIQGTTLAARVANLLSAPWGCSTNFGAALNLILERAVRHEVPPEEMPEMLFVFSDMQFDTANQIRGTDRYRLGYRSGARDAASGFPHALANIRRAYQDAGYVTPHLVFWNLRGKCTTKPCETLSEGCSTMSGYSEAMLKAFMGGKVSDMAKETPWDRMRAVLDDTRYDIVHETVAAHFGVIAPPPNPPADADDDNDSDGGSDFVVVDVRMTSA